MSAGARAITAVVVTPYVRKQKSHAAPPTAARPLLLRVCGSVVRAGTSSTGALLSANRSGDQPVITKLDRLGRSLEHLIELAKLLQARGADLVVVDQGIDTSTAVGRMFFQILGAIAESEHALMSERTIDGPTAARARARTGAQHGYPGTRFHEHRATLGADRGRGDTAPAGERSVRRQRAVTVPLWLLDSVRTAVQ